MGLAPVRANLLGNQVHGDSVNIRSNHFRSLSSELPAHGCANSGTGARHKRNLPSEA
ncbi:hypothetical protein D9M70_641170 [compost metagenome]